jgi:hypothetical protein
MCPAAPSNRNPSPHRLRALRQSWRARAEEERRRRTAASSGSCGPSTPVRRRSSLAPPGSDRISGPSMTGWRSREHLDPRRRKASRKGHRWEASPRQADGPGGEAMTADEGTDQRYSGLARRRVRVKIRTLHVPVSARRGGAAPLAGVRPVPRHTVGGARDRLRSRRRADGEHHAYGARGPQLSVAAAKRVMLAGEAESSFRASISAISRA